jgi:hypothetical protein
MNMKEIYLRDMSKAQSEADRVQNEIFGCVSGARRHGASWAEIAEQLGTSRQAAQQRYGRYTPKPLASTDVVFSSSDK